MAKPRKNGKGGKRKVQDKDDTVETRSGGELSLGEPVVIESDTFHLHMKAIKAATEKKDTANSLLRGCYKAANLVNEHLGNTIKELITMERKDDTTSLKQKLEVLGIGLKEIGSPVQLTVHDTLMGDVKDQAYKRGREAGANGKSLNNPYPASSDLAEAYATGWRNAVGGTLGLSEQETEEAVSSREDPALREHALN